MPKEDDRNKRLDEECLIPGPVPTPALTKYALKRAEHEEDVIRDYIHWQSPKETVSHLEKVATERLFERVLDVWDVRTDQERYWVISNPTNLYSQELFPSLDYTLSFHIGLTARVMAQRKSTADDEQQDRLAAAWRRWVQAAEALDRADEAEEFQAVGMRCRECLLAMIREFTNASIVPTNQEPPKTGDFIHWSGLLANAIAPGASAREIRGYLKALAKSTWQLVAWLTHATSAVRFDANMAVEATQSTLTAFGSALVRKERGTPDRCPRCSSYRITTVHTPDLTIDPPYAAVCESCGWSDASDDKNDLKEDTSK